MDFILGFFLFLLLITIYWYASAPRNLPPGPLGLPFLGSIWETWKGATCCDNLSAWSKKYGSVFKLYVGNQLVVVLGDFDAIQEALVKQSNAYLGRQDFQSVLSKEMCGVGLANSEGELWKNQRRFALSTLRDLGFGRPIIEPQIKDEAQYLVDTIGAFKGKPFVLTPLMDTATVNVICSMVFGKTFRNDDEELAKIILLQKSRLSGVKISFLGVLAMVQAAAKLFKYMPSIKRTRDYDVKTLDFLKRQIPEAMGNFRPEIDQPTNYIQAFYKAQYDNKDDWTFFERQLLGSVLNLFVGGSDSTSTTLCWSVFFMCHNPHIQEQVYQEIVKETGGRSLLNFEDRTKLPYTEAVLMEVQRVATLLPVSVLRRSVAPTKLRGYDIPENTIIAPLLGAVLNDPIVYPNPEKFDPGRFLHAKKNDKEWEYMIPFSVGKRSCIGEALAKMEIFIFFTSLVSKYKLYFSPDEQKPPLGAPSALMRAPPKFKVCAELRSD